MTYVKAGALLALYSTPAQIGQQAGEVARQGLASGSLQPPAAPRHFRIGTNPYVARSLGISLEDASVLQERLERAEGHPVIGINSLDIRAGRSSSPCCRRWSWPRC